MIRPILALSAAAAALILAACDKPSALTRAQTGECYQVIGKDSLGSPQFARTACATGGGATGDGVQTAAGEPTASPAAICPKVPACGGAGSTPEASTGARAYIATSAVRAGKAVRGAGRHRRAGGASSREYTGLGIEYARVSDDGADSGYSREGGRSAYSVQSSSSEQSSSFYSESGSISSAYGLAGGPCCMPGGPRSAPGPHSPFDRNGFLTWQGKVAYQPGR